MIDKKKLLVNIIISICVILYLSLFVSAGVNKIKTFNDQSLGLSKKLNISNTLGKIGISSAIFIELILSLVIILYFITVPYLKQYDKISSKTSEIINYIMIGIISLFIIFMITITIIYHPPKDDMGVFLNRLTIIGGFGFLLAILVNDLEN